VSDRDRRALLWLCCAGICWRWFVGIRAPLPGVDACRDLWLAEQLVGGDFTAVFDRALEPLYALLLAPALAFGASPFAATQVVASLLGGLVVVPAALAAERMREGAGVSAAAVSMVAAGPVVAAGAGAATAMFTLLSACCLWAFATRRLVLSGVLLLVVVASGTDQIASMPQATWHELRLGVGSAVLLMPLLLLSPRSRLFGLLVGVQLVLVAIAWLLDAWTSFLPLYSPLLAVLAGLGLARLPVRLRDVLLSVIVAIECHAAWTLGEPEAAVIERVLPQYLIRRLHAEGDIVLSNLPRVRWSAGQNPSSATHSYVDALRDDKVASIIMTAGEAKDASLRALLAAKFERAPVPTDIAELLLQRSLHVLRRRHQ
jgi:hypothetical protein